LSSLYPEILGGQYGGKPGWPAYASVMVSAWARIRARERIEALGAAELEDRDPRRQVLAVLREVIDFDALTSALRQCRARTFVEPSTPRRSDAGPVVLTLDDDLRITSRTAASQAWLKVLLPPGPDERAIPASVYNVAAQLLAAETGIDDHPAYARTHLAGASGSPCGRPARTTSRRSSPRPAPGTASPSYRALWAPGVRRTH
jgi:hypothetical protein